MIDLYKFYIYCKQTEFSLMAQYSPKMATRSVKHYDTHTLYVTSGVAREEQLYESLRIAIKNGEDNYYLEILEKILEESKVENSLDNNVTQIEKAEKIEKIKQKLDEIGCNYPPKPSWDCRIRVNLIVNKLGEFFGFGYIFVSNTEVYWMLLGKNPDGSERVIQYLDPNWVPQPTLTEEQEAAKYQGMAWNEIVDEENKYACQVIKKVLDPLMPIPGYVYDEQQYKHLQDMAISSGTDPSLVPTTGYFVLSRAYVKNVEPGKVENQLCARQIPKWVPSIAFKQIFKDYMTEEDDEKYPTVELIDGKKDNGNIALITFKSRTKKAQFTLLMTRKVHIIHPNNPEYECTLVFNHAYEENTKRDKNARTDSQGKTSRNDSRSHDKDSRSRGEMTRSRDKNTRNNGSRSSGENTRNDSRSRDKNTRNDSRSRDKNTRNDSRNNGSRDGMTRSRDKNHPLNKIRSNSQEYTTLKNNSESSEDIKKRDDVDISKYNYTRN